MKSLIGLLCLLFWIYSPIARASEDYVLNAAVSATECHIVEGINICLTAVDQRHKNIVVPLSECDSQGPGWETCLGKWEGSRSLNNQNFMIQISVQKSIHPDFESGNAVTQYMITASIRVDGAHWRYLHVTTGSKAALTDTIQMDGEEYSAGPGANVTPGLTVGPMLP